MMIKRSMFCALLCSLAACGSDERDLDIQAFIPRPPVHAMSVAAPAVAAPPAIERPKLVAPTTFDAAMLEGKALAEKGETANAKLIFEAAIKLDKKSAEPHLELAKLYIASGDRGLAMAAANKAVKLAPLSSQAWNTKGRAELNRFAYDDAIEAFTKAVELNRDNAWAWNNLGYTELQLQKYEEAAAHLGEAVSKPGATGYMFNNLGTALEHLDRLDDARTAFEGGAKLGSKASAASRTRLEGVESIAINDKPTKPDATQTYDNGEGPAEPDAKIEDPDIELVAPEGSDADAPLTPKAEAPSDAGVPTM